jgi:type II secretion system protein N
MARLDWNVWRPRLGYAAFAVAAFLVALRATFPYDAVRERITRLAAASGYAVEAQELGPGGGLLGVTARGLTVDDGSGLKFPVEEVTASLRLWTLLTGHPSVAFDVRIWDGRIIGTVGVSGAERALELNATGLDLARALPLRRASGLELVGKLFAEADLVLPATPQGKAAGAAQARVEGAGVSGGQVPVPGMEGGLPVPKLSLGEVAAQLKVDQGKATFEKLEALGGDAELTTSDLFLVLQRRFRDSPVSGRARLRIKDAFWTQSGTQGLRGIAESAMAAARGSDGWYTYQLSGSVGRPTPRPAGVR